MRLMKRIEKNNLEWGFFLGFWVTIFDFINHIHDWFKDENTTTT